MSVLIIWHSTPPKTQSRPAPQAIIDAKLLFLPKAKPAKTTEPQPKPVEQQTEPKATEPAKPQIPPEQPNLEPALTKPTTAAQPSKEITEKDISSVQAEPSNSPTTEPLFKTVSQPRAVFNPSTSISNLIESQQQDFMAGVSQPKPKLPDIKSSNSIDDPALKPLYETAHQISPTTRIINYNGKCVQIERKLDHNGFSYFSWSGYSGGCGQGNATEKLLKESIEKYTKPKNIFDNKKENN